MMRPVTGAAIHSMGIRSMSAPRVWKIRLTFAFCSAKPNWIPRNPKLIFHICQKLSFGLSLIVSFIIKDQINSTLVYNQKYIKNNRISHLKSVHLACLRASLNKHQISNVSGRLK
jgi:hypothetical protein